MKIKEVCNLTNLTERTIRFYVEKGLIVPQVENINGREYRNYSKDDVKQLRLIAELRKMFFSIDSIIKMLNNPSEIQNVLQQHQQIMLQDYAAKGELIEAIKKVDISAIHSVRELVDTLDYLLIKYNLPISDIEPCFGRDDLETEEEKAVLSEQAWKNIRKRNQSKIIITAIIIFILSVCSLLGFKIYKYQNEKVYATVYIPSIKFTKKFLDNNNILVGQFQIFENNELENNTISATFDKGTTGYVLYNSILTNEMYAAIGLNIEMKRVTAIKLGLMEKNDALKLDTKKILLDADLSQKYLKIATLQGDLQVQGEIK